MNLISRLIFYHGTHGIHGRGRGAESGVRQANIKQDEDALLACYGIIWVGSVMLYLLRHWRSALHFFEKFLGVHDGQINQHEFQ